MMVYYDVRRREVTRELEVWRYYVVIYALSYLMMLHVLLPCTTTTASTHGEEGRREVGERENKSMG